MPRSPRMLYLPYKVKKSKPGKVAKLKDLENPKGTTMETRSFLKLIRRRRSPTTSTIDRETCGCISPPLRLYVEQKVRPLVCNKPGNTLLHFQAEVKTGLDKNVRLGVLQKMPPDAPVHSYLHRMGIAKKRTGKVNCPR